MLRWIASSARRHSPITVTSSPSSTRHSGLAWGVVVDDEPAALECMAVRKSKAQPQTRSEDPARSYLTGIPTNSREGGS